MSNNNSRYISDDTKEQAVNRNGMKCYSCGKQVSDFTTPGYRPNQLHYDHKVPHSTGGSSDISNINVSCAECNLKKGDKTQFQFEKAEFGETQCQAHTQAGPRCSNAVKPGNKKYCGTHETSKA